MRTALGRARRLVALLLLGLSAWWLLVRRRTAAWTELPGPSAPPPADQPGPLPADVLATDAGLTELPPDRPDTAAESAAVESADTDAGLGELPPGAAAAGTGAPTDADVAPELPVGTLPVGAPAAEPLPAGMAGSAELAEEVTAAEPVVVEDAPPAEPAMADASPPAEPAMADASPPAEPVVAEEAPPAAPLVAGAPAGEPVVAEDAAAAEPVVAGEAPRADDLDGPTGQLPRPVFAETPSPAFSDAPTMEMPVLMDDLRSIRGIGPSMERMLHGLGIVSFRQLALLDGGELQRVRDELQDFRSRIEREDWIGQARQLHKAKYGTDPV